MEPEDKKVNLSGLKLPLESKPGSQASISDTSHSDSASLYKNSPNDQKVPTKDSPVSKVKYRKEPNDLRSIEKENKRRKSRSRSRKRRRSKSRTRNHKDKKSKKSRSFERHEKRTHKSKKSRKRSRSRSRHRHRHKKSPLVIESIIQDKKMDKIIDKKRLLALAKVDNSDKIDPNFINIFRAPDISQPKLTFNREDKSIDQFVELCKNLSHVNSDQNEPIYSNLNQTKENDFQISDHLKDKSVNNDAISKLFPVSSGSQHRCVLEQDDSLGNGEKIVTDCFNVNSLEKTDLGKYTGLIDSKFLTPEQLKGEFIAWTKKDLLNSGSRMTDGFGKKLLEKMGWKEGEGLGRNGEGPIEPIKLDIKLNRKGLEAEGLVTESIQKQIEGKHPVSCLLELCRARKWSDPIYEVVEESGPAHQKNFVIKVVLNGVSYQPCEPSANKKIAKAMAAFDCLQALGIQSTIPS